jgi:hypothetical protein
MNEQLLETLRGFRQDLGLVVVLYQQLFEGRFWVLAQRPAEQLETMLFLNYPAQGGVRELPVFTARDRGLLTKFTAEVPDCMMVEIEGARLWPRLLDIVRTRELEAAVDPGEQYGIRLTREMILGMISQYETAQPSA